MTLAPDSHSFASLADAVYRSISLPRRDEAIKLAAEDIYYSAIERVMARGAGWHDQSCQEKLRDTLKQQVSTDLTDVALNLIALHLLEEGASDRKLLEDWRRQELLRGGTKFAHRELTGALVTLRAVIPEAAAEDVGRRFRRMFLAYEQASLAEKIYWEDVRAGGYDAWRRRL